MLGDGLHGRLRESRERHKHSDNAAGASIESRPQAIEIADVCLRATRFDLNQVLVALRVRKEVSAPRPRNASIRMHGYVPASEQRTKQDLSRAAARGCTQRIQALKLLA
jgi:hypothetical protein